MARPRPGTRVRPDRMAQKKVRMTIEEAIAEERRQRREKALSSTKAEAGVGPSGDALKWDGGPQPAMRWRVRALQMIATVFLYLMFVTNQLLNPDSFEVRTHLETLQLLSVQVGALAGLVIGALLCKLPDLLETIVDNWEGIFFFRYTRFRGFVTLVVILVIITLLVTPRYMYILGVQAFIGFFYLAPIIFGMYGIWNMKGTHVITACMFSFFTAISRPKPPSDLGIVLLFATSFLLFAEVSASAIRQYILAAEELVPVRFQTKMVDRYLVYLTAFGLMTVGLTALALWTRAGLDLLSPPWATEALEVQGLLGLVIPALAVVVLVLILKWVLEGRHKEWLRPIKDEETKKKVRSVLSRFLLPDTGTEAT